MVNVLTLNVENKLTMDIGLSTRFSTFFTVHWNTMKRAKFANMLLVTVLFKIRLAVSPFRSS